MSRIVVVVVVAAGVLSLWDQYLRLMSFIPRLDSRPESTIVVCLSTVSTLAAAPPPSGEPLKTSFTDRPAGSSVGECGLGSCTALPRQRHKDRLFADHFHRPGLNRLLPRTRAGRKWYVAINICIHTCI